MRQNSGSDGEAKPRLGVPGRAESRLRAVMMIPLVWTVFVVVIPDFVMGVFDINPPWIHAACDFSALAVTGGALLYLLLQIRQERRVTHLLVLGVGLVLVSQILRIARVLQLLDFLHQTQFGNGYHIIQVFDDALNGLGLVAITAAFFMAIVDLFAAKQRLACQQKQLSEEIVRRVQTEQEILDEKQRYKDLVNNLPVAVYRNTPGPEGRFLEMNPAHVAMLEAKSEEELLHRAVSDLYRDPSLRERFAAKLMREGSVKNEEVELVTLQGKPIWGSVTAVVKRDPQGQPYIDGVIEDITERKLAHQALRESEEMLRFMIGTVEDVFWQMSQDLRFTYISPAVEPQCGYTPQEMIGHSLLEFLTPRSAAAQEEDFQARRQLSEGGVLSGSITYEVEFICKDQRVIWCEANSTPLLNPKGTVRGFQGVTRDITRRKQVENTLRKYGRILSATSDFISLVDRNYCYQVVNDAYAKATNKNSDELLGRHIREVVGSETFEKTVKPLVDRCLAGEVTGYEGWYEFESAGRLYLSVSYSPYVDVDGTIAGIVVSGRDITNRKIVEEDLKVTGAKLADALRVNQTLIEASTLGILAYEASGQCVLANEAMGRIVGATAEQLLKQNFRSVASWQRYGLLSLADMTLTTGEPCAGQLYMVTTFGKEVWIEYHMARFAGGGEEHLLFIADDISEQVHAEHMIAEQRISMVHAARMSALGLMAAGIAHEIRNPLAIISAGAQQLETQFRSQEPNIGYVRRSVEVITRNVERIDRTINALRSLSRESSQDPCEEASVRRIVADAVELCQYRFKERGVSLLLSDIADIKIECRASQLSQVLLNLLNNAYDAIESLSETWIRLDLEDEGDTVVFSVTDSGHGISADAYDKVFVPFYTTKKEGKGVGLGLSLSRNIIEGHNGELNIDSRCPNTRFIVRIPKRQDSPHEGRA